MLIKDRRNTSDSRVRHEISAVIRVDSFTCDFDSAEGPTGVEGILHIQDVLVFGLENVEESALVIHRNFFLLGLLDVFDDRLDFGDVDFFPLLFDGVFDQSRFFSFWLNSNF